MDLPSLEDCKQRLDGHFSEIIWEYLPWQAVGGEDLQCPFQAYDSMIRTFGLDDYLQFSKSQATS